MSRLLTLCGVLLLAACGDDQISGGDTTGNTTAIRVGNNFFAPTSSSVALDATVTWTWDPGGVPHNVTFDDGPASVTQSSGTYQRTFPVMGSYAYHCTVHGAAMSGSITVVP